jgi:hypothetical protein
MSDIPIDINPSVSIRLCMRTTLNLEDELFPLVRAYADGLSISLGEAVSELVRLGLASRKPVKIKTVNGFAVVVLPKGTPKVTSEHVKKLLAESE